VEGQQVTDALNQDQLGAVLMVKPKTSIPTLGQLALLGLLIYLGILVGMLIFLAVKIALVMQECLLLFSQQIHLRTTQLHLVHRLARQITLALALVALTNGLIGIIKFLTWTLVRMEIMVLRAALGKIAAFSHLLILTLTAALW